MKRPYPNPHLRTKLMTLSKSNIVKAEVRPVRLVSIYIDGLLTEEGEYRVAVPQICELFSFLIHNASRDIKALLGKDFSFLQVKTPLNSKAVNTVSIDDFERILRKLDKAGNPVAEKLAEDLIGLSIRQCFADDFNENFEKEARQLWADARGNGIFIRNELTDAIKEWLATNQSKDFFLYGACSSNTYLAIFKMTRDALLRSRGYNPADGTPRNFMSVAELTKVAEFEHHAAILINRGTHPMQAVKGAKQFYGY